MQLPEECGSSKMLCISACQDPTLTISTDGAPAMACQRASFQMAWPWPSARLILEPHAVQLPKRYCSNKMLCI